MYEDSLIIFISLQFPPCTLKKIIIFCVKHLSFEYLKCRLIKFILTLALSIFSLCYIIIP